MDQHVEIPDSKYGECIVINEYNGEISLVLGNVSGDKVYKKWCFPEYKKEPRTKSVPWKIPLGSGIQAERTLTALLAIISADRINSSKGGIPKADITPPFDDNDPNEIPF